MIVTHKINMDLQIQTTPPRVHMVQNDTDSRVVELTMLSAGVLWEPEELSMVFLRYRRSDGAGGSYDSMADGSLAWEWEGSILRLRIAPQMLAVPGLVEAQVVLLRDTSFLATFTFHILVEEDPSAQTVQPENYINWAAWSLQELDNRLAEAQESGLFKGSCFIPAVDAQGNLSWTNDGGMVNPQTVNLMGPAGQDGTDGYTPVRGEDYFTEADKTEMIELVLAALPTWEGGSY